LNRYESIEKTETKAGYIKGPTREDIIKWICIAWRNITKDTIEKAFTKAKLLEYYEGRLA